ncbi:MAG: TerB N-terminal domain-containing protein, partial [Cyanobacteria bacterium P01_F01_bin.42]
MLTFRMKVLRLIWRILAVVFREITILWNRYRDHRALKSEKVQPPPVKWIPPGASVQIKDVLVADGFLYVGTGRPEEEAELPYWLDPALEVTASTEASRPAVLAMDWSQSESLSYSTLSPEMRGVYLEWLAAGRKDRDVPDSALLLFLYGLEHRVIQLLTCDRTVEELLALILELERLEVHYASCAAVVPSIKSLMECCQVQLSLTCQPETLLALLPQQQGISTALKVAIGRCIETAKPMPMLLLWSWYQSSSVAVPLKTPARRCENEFRLLLQMRGAALRHLIETDAEPALLPVIYEPINPGPSAENGPVTVVETIDIAELEPQLAVLEPLIEACTRDLDAYSRLLGRSPELAGTPAAVALLPQELVLRCGNDQVRALQSWCDQVLENADLIDCPGEQLIDRWPTVAA